MPLRREENDFPDVNEAEWRRLAETALGGDGFETLVSHTEDGVEYGPIHARRAPARPISRGETSPWRIVQRVDDPEPARANAQALADLEGGADALSLVFTGAPSAYGFGLPLTAGAVNTALREVLPEMVRIRIEPHPDLDVPIGLVRDAFAGRTDAGARRLDIDHGLDPVGCLAATGRLPLGDEARLGAHLRDAWRRFREDGGGGRMLEADGRPYHEAGASEAQELGAVLAGALCHLRLLSGAGGDAGEFGGGIGVTLAADQKQFLATAKIRAMRLLWGKLFAECGVERARRAVRIHVETSRRMMAAQDPHTNILRTTIAAFAAATGGADSLSVLPFAAALGLPEEKARRLARNIQAILQDESGLARVADPAAGSGGIERLTHGLAEAGWAEFRRIEAEGGILESLRQGRLQSRIAATRRARAAAIAEGREPIIGVTLYPPSGEPDVPVLTAHEERWRGPYAAGEDMDCEPLVPVRLAEDLEAAA